MLCTLCKDLGGQPGAVYVQHASYAWLFNSQQKLPQVLLSCPDTVDGPCLAGCRGHKPLRAAQVSKAYTKIAPHTSLCSLPAGQQKN